MAIWTGTAEFNPLIDPRLVPAYGQRVHPLHSLPRTGSTLVARTARSRRADSDIRKTSEI